MMKKADIAFGFHDLRFRFNGDSPVYFQVRKRCRAQASCDGLPVKNDSFAFIPTGAVYDATAIK